MSNQYRKTAYEKIETDLQSKISDLDTKLEDLKEELEYACIVRNYVNIFSNGYNMEYREEELIQNDIDQVNKEIKKIKRITDHLTLNKSTILK